MATKLNRVRKYKWSKRIKTHGFRARMKTKDGKKVILRRMKKWRKVLTVSDYKRKFGPWA